MKKFIIKASLFLILIYIIDKPVGYFISKMVRNKQVDNRLELLAEKKIDHDLIIIGSSRAVNDISPEIIDKTLGISSYNMGYSGSNLIFHESILNLILNYHQPKKLLMTVDGALTFQPTDKGIFRADKLEPYLCYYPVYRQYSDHTEKNYRAGTISWTYRENQNFFPALEYLKNGKDIGDETSDINEYGAIFLEGDHGGLQEVEESKRIVEYTSENENDSLVTSFLNILNTCEKEQIDLTIIIPPNYGIISPGFNARIKELTEQRFPILNFSDSLQNPELFFDNGHLNYDGAMAFSKMITKHLKK